ncbi:MAG: hypothetical protein KatS3mg087_0062 [Patescibacteria group bacterium]|nr:MAG: hypothetical protein KatS3mg087_0062 [Patescibacteria group bacterium]
MYLVSVLPERRGGTLLLAAWHVPDGGTVPAGTTAAWARRLFYRNGGVKSAPVQWVLRTDVSVGPEIPHLVEDQILDQVVDHFRGERIRPGMAKTLSPPRFAGRRRGIFIDLR